MYSSIRIQGYRGFDSFRLKGLGRVNLLVGANNSGKTSILECIELLRSADNPHVLSAIAGRRGEWAYSDDGDTRASIGVRPDSPDVSHLFPNHELGGTIRIEGVHVEDAASAARHDYVTVGVTEPSDSEREERNSRLDDEYADAHLDLRIVWSNAEGEYARHRAFVTDEGVLLWPRRLPRARNGASQAVQFIRTSGMKAADVARTYSRIKFGDKDESIKTALRIVEPALEDLAPDARGPRFYRDAPGGVVLKLRGTVGQVPIGSMGDGMWRMLGLALSISNAGGGVLLVDEIDTGLHHSVMEDMWRMVGERAAALSVQVFATTHSEDCYESLAAIANPEADDVTIQRIDRARAEAIRYNSQAVIAAAERRSEVR